MMSQNTKGSEARVVGDFPQKTRGNFLRKRRAIFFQNA